MNVNFKIVVPSELINSSIEKTLIVCEKTKDIDNSNFGFNVLELLKKNFKPTNDLTIIGIFLYIFHSENLIYEDIFNNGGGHVNVRLITKPVIEGLLNINRKVLQPLWDELHNSAELLKY